MLYAYCIRKEESQDDFLENSFIGELFGAKMVGTASWVGTL